VGEQGSPSGEVNFGGGSWAVEVKERSQEAKAVLRSEVVLRAKVMDGAVKGGSVGVGFEFQEWSPTHYLFMPGAVYAGNRFQVLPGAAYPPKPSAEMSCLDCPPHIADIPRLELGSGRSRIQMLAGGMSWPGCGFFDPARKVAWFVSAPSHAAWGEVGLDFEENATRSGARLVITVPGVREQCYDFWKVSAGSASPDKGRDLVAGDEVELVLSVREWGCADADAFFACISEFMREEAARHTIPATLPFSAMHRLIEEHYERDFWWPQAGLYRVSTDDGNPYQTGWCGGIIAEFALLANSDSAQVRERCREHLNRCFTQGMARGGLFYGKYHQGGWVSDCWRDAEKMPWRAKMTLTRRQGDALLYSLKAVSVLEAKGEDIPDLWDAALRRNAQALCEVWRRDGQFGQFLDQEENRVLLGNSSSGGMIPGALVLAHRRYSSAEFLAVAQEAGRYYDEQFLQKGITTGGPSDAGQAPDSESCAGLLESYALLYEATRAKVWLDCGRRAANQAATWVMPFNFPFASDTEFGRLEMKTVGTVLANAQNKHSAPGICTHAGAGLLRLFRATGELALLETLRDIARTLPQYVSREDRPIHDSGGRALPSGWINERVNINDWDHNVGGVFYGPCWCEVSAIVSFADLPGIYAQPDTRLIRAIDHVEAVWAGEGKLKITNPTPFPAKVRCLIESSVHAGKTSLPDAWRLPTVEIGPGESVTLG
jgi:hypothetical protein